MPKLFQVEEDPDCALLSVITAYRHQVCIQVEPPTDNKLQSFSHEIRYRIGPESNAQGERPWDSKRAASPLRTPGPLCSVIVFATSVCWMRPIYYWL